MHTYQVVLLLKDNHPEEQEYQEGAQDLLIRLLHLKDNYPEEQEYQEATQDLLTHLPPQLPVVDLGSLQGDR